VTTPEKRWLRSDSIALWRPDDGPFLADIRAERRRRAFALGVRGRRRGAARYRFMSSKAMPA